MGWLDFAGRLWIKPELAGGAVIGLLTEVNVVLRVVQIVIISSGGLMAEG